MGKRTLFCFSSIEWDFLWQRHQTFMTLFEKHGYSVVFLENTGFRNPQMIDLNRIFRKLKKIFVKQNKNRIKNNNIEVIPSSFLPPNGFIFRWINKNILIPKFLKKRNDTRKYNIGFIYLPSSTTLELIKQMNFDLIIFDYVANFNDHPYKPKDYKYIEDELLRIANIVLTDSDYLFAKLTTKHKNVIQVHHGVNYQHYANFANQYGGPNSYKRLCFFGAIDHRIDWDPVLKMVENGYHVDLIGSVSVEVPKGISVVPPISYDELPNKINHYDAYIIPYKISGFTKGIVPAKIFECFAMGKPLLISRLPSIEKYNKLLYICNTAEEFVRTAANLHVTETEEIVQMRKQIAMENSSESAFNNILRVIREFDNER